MGIFTPQTDTFFEQAKWETQGSKKAPARKKLPAVKGRALTTISTDDTRPFEANPNQFILLQLNDDASKRVLSTSEVTPKLAGNSGKPDITMALDFDGFKIGSNEDVDKDTKATLQLTIGQEQTLSGLDKLFYCINGGLDLYNELKGKKADAKDFKKNTADALGRKPISLPGGLGQISLKVVKHPQPKWWQKIFSFAKSDKGKELLSLVGFPGITEAAVNTIGGMLDSLFDKEPEVLFQSLPIKVALTQAAKEEMSGGLSTNYVSCLNQGFWIMARQSDYQAIVNAKPIYYSGYGILAPDGMSEIDAIQDKANNPFSKMTYAIIRARMKEVDLSQHII